MAKIEFENNFLGPEYLEKLIELFELQGWGINALVIAVDERGLAKIAGFNLAGELIIIAER